VIGGGGRILRDGQNATAENVSLEGIGEAFLTNRHPRTFVASDRDGRRVWLGTVDGRQAASVGMNFDEMADFLLDLGAWDAVNLDGGGSTTMVVGDSVVNRPSDATGERAVANILFVERLVSGQ
jgi:exopolysaccharide biosynthesis protein